MEQAEQVLEGGDAAQGVCDQNSVLFRSLLRFGIVVVLVQAFTLLGHGILAETFPTVRAMTPFAVFLIDIAVFILLVVPVCYHWIVRPVLQSQNRTLDEINQDRRRLVDSQRIARIGYSSWTSGDRHHYWSNECFRILELDPTTTMPSHEMYLARVHPADRESLENALAAANRENSSGNRSGCEMVHRLLLPDGRVKWVRIQSETTFDDDGNVVHIGGTLQDLTETVYLADALRDSEDRFRATFEQAAVGMANITVDGRWGRVNARLCEILGYSKDELLAMSFWDIVHPEDREMARQDVNSALAGDWVSYDREKRFIRKDDTVAWVQLTISLTFDAAEESGHFIAVIQDIGERKRAEQGLELKTAHLQSVLENVGHGIRLTNSDGELLTLNNTFFDFLDLPRGVFPPGMLLEDAVHYMAERGEFGDGDINEMVADVMSRALRPGQGTYEHIRPDGTILQVYHVAIPGGDLLTTYTDITERKRMERNLSAALRDAEEANRAKSDFLATMSHELRTPLNAILGFAEILSHQYFGPMGQRKYVEYAEDIESSGRYLLELVNDVLDISRIEAGEYMLDTQEMDLVSVVGECVMLISNHASAAKIDLKLEIRENLPQLVADRRAVKQMVLNLISNSIKFTDAGGVITVSIGSETGYQVITVRDNGIGIDEDEIPFLLEPFRRGRIDPDISGTGSGLGLAITHSLVRLHNGSVQVDSTIGEGTTVRISLPYDS